MRSFWSDPYLWIHLAGVAALPLFLEICFLGLAVGDPVLPLGLELLLVAVVGIAPIVWMQWQRPFYIFSLMAIALKPEQLTVDQRKLLRLFKSPVNRGLVVGVSGFLFWVLWQLYRYAPIASDVTPLTGGARGWGLLLAAIAFLASNLFLQVPVSVASVLLTGEAAFATTEPYPVEQISADFTVLGWQVKRILPDVVVSERPKASLKPTFSSKSIPERNKPDLFTAQFPPDNPVELANSTEFTVADSTVADSTDEETLIRAEPLVESKSFTEAPFTETPLTETPSTEASLTETGPPPETALVEPPVETALAEIPLDETEQNSSKSDLQPSSEEP